MTNAPGVLLRTTALAGSMCGFGLSLPAHAQSMTDLGTLGSPFSVALGVSADGSVIVGYSSTTDFAPPLAFKCLSSELLNDIRYL